MSEVSGFSNKKISGIKKWAGRGTWTVLDQALFSGANFVLSILLARWLSEDSFGAFSVAYGIFIFLGATIHTGFFTEPMLVYGSGNHKKNLPDYLGILLRGHILFTAISWIGFLIGALIVWRNGSIELSFALAVTGFAQIFILFMWMLRRSFYIILFPMGAVVSSLIYATVMLGGMFLFYKIAVLSSVTALVIMSISSFVAGLWVVFNQKISVFGKKSPELINEIFKEHWKYGRWAVPSNIVMSVPSQLPLLVLSAVSGLAVSGAFKAIRIFAMPAAQAYSALFILLVPAFVKAEEKGKLNKFIFTSAIIITFGTSLYWLILVLFGEPLMLLFYKGKYTEYIPLLWIVGLQPVVAGITAVYGAGLRALKLPKYVFWSYCGVAVGIATIGVWAIYKYGVKGALFGYPICNVIGIIMMLYFFYVRRHKIKNNNLKESVNTVTVASVES